MSEESTEQRPLLSDDLSEEERFPDFPRRYRPNYRGRAKLSAKGATAIITRWPGHWTSSLKYWWIGLSIMAVTFFLIYNTIVAFVLLPSVNTKPASLRTMNQANVNAPSFLPEIFMPVIVNTDEDANLDKILPYVEIISDQNLDFNFNLIFLFNSTAHKTYSDEKNNEIALNSLWSKEHFYEQKQNPYKNIKIRQVDLSQFMDESPMKAKWRHVPAHLIDFLVKSLFIWDKGGVAINPQILTPRTSNTKYLEKLQHILNKFKKQREYVPKEPKLKKVVNKHKEKNMKKVNNIRDIINILEHEDDIKNNLNNHITQENLTEAESLNVPVVSHDDPKIHSTKLQASKYKSKFPAIIELPKIPIFSMFNDTSSLDENKYHVTNSKPREDEDSTNSEKNKAVNEDFDISYDHSEMKFSLLPFFLDFLFHDKQKVIQPENSQEDTNNLLKQQKSDIPKVKTKRNVSVLQKFNDTKTVESFKPMIIPAKGIVSDRLLKTSNPLPIDTTREIHPEELTIDLKGNIIATKTSCHAFIGTLFSNAIHHPPGETLQDFIITELSLFCKGLLSSCRGIDVILL